MKRYIVTPKKIEKAQIAIILVCFDFSSYLRDAIYGFNCKLQSYNRI